MTETRIAYDTLCAEFVRVLLEHGFPKERAALCARLFADASRDGVPSHGLNRFPSFIRNIRDGIVRVDAVPRLCDVFGPFERWDGCLGPGNLNAHFCMERAMALAREFTLGCVALRNTNHWMRAGNCGWQAAEAGFLAVCWTNTIPNTAAWGTRGVRLGNNPLVIAVPRPAGHVVLDMAMSQFSWGKLKIYGSRGEPLPFDGGWDVSGRLTRDAEAILKTRLMLPIGFWKGSGLILMLDLLAALLSGGNATRDLEKVLPEEYGSSQVFAAIDLCRLAPEDVERTIDAIVAHYQGDDSEASGGRTTYPGERTLKTRRENLEKGIPVDPFYWDQVRGL